MPQAQSKRKMMRAASIDNSMMCGTKFEIQEAAMPAMPVGGALIRVCYAGACAPDSQRARDQIRNRGIMDNSLFPGYEVSGIVESICPQAEGTTVKIGDRCVVYPEEDVGYDQGISEFVAIKNLKNILPIPDNLALDTAALLPCGGLTAYSSVIRAKPYIDSIKQTKGKCNILVIGAGGLGLWTTLLARHLSGPEVTCDLNVRVIVADTNSEKLMLAKSHGCQEVVHWSRNAYEADLIERTKNCTKGGIDIVIDFVSSQRSISRATKCLNKHGAIVVGGNCQQEVSIDVAALAKNEQCILGTRRGTRQDLEKLVRMVAQGTVSTPHFETFPITKATEVFKGLSDSNIKGRAVFSVGGYCF